MKHTDAEILAAVPPALRPQVAADLRNARLMAQMFDVIFGKPARDFHDDADTCQRCGAKHRGTGCRCTESQP